MHSRAFFGSKTRSPCGFIINVRISGAGTLEYLSHTVWVFEADAVASPEGPEFLLGDEAFHVLCEEEALFVHGLYQLLFESPTAV